jgi:hypothetical protein
MQCRNGMEEVAVGTQLPLFMNVAEPSQRKAAAFRLSNDTPIRGRGSDG